MTKEMIKKIQIVFIVFVILMMGIIGKVFATEEYTCTLTVEPDKTQIKAGEEVTLSVKVSNINAGNGIAIFNTILEYDADIFDLKVQADSKGNWTSTALENSITFTKANYEATTEDQEIGRIILTAKQDATIGKQTISLTKNEFSDSTTFSVEDVSTTIEIVENTEQPDNPDNPDNPGDSDDNQNTTGGNNTNTPSGGNNTNTPSGGNNTGRPSGGNSSVNYSNSGIVNSGKSENVLPKTGTLQNILIGVIFIAIVVSITFYIKYKRTY